MCLPPPVNQSIPALISSFLPQSSSYVDMNQGNIIEETIKQIAQSINQMLLKASTTNSPQNNATCPYDQSTVFLQQFSMIMQDLKNVMDKVSSDITKITHAYTTAQENTGKLIKNVISQALTKSQDNTPPNPALDPRSNQTANSSYEANWTYS